MNETKQHHAYQRGVSMASLWKRLKGTILKWDAICVAKARSHKLPCWVGHIPMSMLVVAMMSAVVFGGIIIASSAVLLGGLILAGSIFSSKEKITDSSVHTDSTYKSPTEYRADGEFGPGWYAGNYKVSDDY
ncbi:hypothetical protein ACJ8LR_24000 [Serratia sp. CY56810]|uniref:hypothetical protein n=1 Tax=Serratia sp. CY56810 TaxID=3383642 RepID=UPI003FA04EF9